DEGGAFGYQANNEASANDNFDLLRWRAVMADGLLINVPETDPAAAARAVERHFDPDVERLNVYIAVPAARPGAPNFQRSGGPPEPHVRFLPSPRGVVDWSAGAA